MKNEKISLANLIIDAKSPLQCLTNFDSSLLRLGLTKPHGDFVTLNMTKSIKP